MKERRKIPGIIRNITCVVLACVLIFQIFMLWSLKQENDQLKKLPILLFEVTSDSMYPTCKTGDGVLDIRTPFDELKEGDLITFFQAGEVITHKIRSLNDDGTLTTYGLVTGAVDSPVGRDEYIGKVILVLPGLSIFLGMIQGPIRKLVWILLLFVLLFGPELIFRILEKREQRRT